MVPKTKADGLFDNRAGQAVRNEREIQRLEGLVCELNVEVGILKKWYAEKSKDASKAYATIRELRAKLAVANRK